MIITLQISFAIIALLGGLYSCLPEKHQIKITKKLHAPIDQLEFYRIKLQVEKEVLHQNLFDMYSQNIKVRGRMLNQIAKGHIKIPITFIVLSIMALIVATIGGLSPENKQHASSLFLVIECILLIFGFIGLFKCFLSDLGFQISQINVLSNYTAIILSLYITVPLFYVISWYLSVIRKFGWKAPGILLLFAITFGELVERIVGII